MKKILLFTAAAAIIIWILYAFLYGPKLKKITEYKNNINMYNRQISLLTKDQVILDKKSGIINRNDIPTIIENLIVDASKGLNIDYSAITPSNIINGEKYRILPVNINFSCDYAGLLIYLRNIEEMQNPFRVSEISLEKTDKFPAIKAKIKVSAFLFSKQSQANLKKPDIAIAQLAKDPFFIESSVSTAEPINIQITPKLSGIWYDNNPKAYIDDKTVSIGDTIYNYRVASITKNTVLLKSKDNVMKLMLKEEK